MTPKLLAAICLVLLPARALLAQPSQPPPEAAAQVPAEAPAPAAAAQPTADAPPQQPATAAPQAPYAQPYAPPPPEQLLRRRSLLENELRQLEDERAELSLGMPITLLIVGGGAFVIGGFIVLVAAMSDAVCSDYDYDSEYDTYDDCDGPDDSVYLVGGAAMLGGGVAAIVGLVTLIDRAGERRVLGRRIKEIRRELQAQPIYGFRLDKGGARATVALRF